MSFERIDSGKRPQQFFPDATQNSFAVMAIVLLFIVVNSAESAGSVFLSYQPKAASVALRQTP
jgi:cyclic lactone autoinducer peptide